MDPKPNLILKIGFKIQDEDGLKNRCDQVKEWYNRHWFMDEKVLKDWVKQLILEHLEVTIDRENK